ncbi:MAG: AAA family ATPase [Boseongicola sp. SB0673_bin_14]|nr:AAA family ATPase [Boseongicola sp. SB0673_bin_14]
MGSVNLRAEAEADEAAAEIDKLSESRSELVQAVEKLRSAINRLNREARGRLRNTFGTVDQHFQSVFKTLFQGGEARLELVDSEDPLEAGLEIVASPPGKQLQKISLLSGGEKALAALSLIFAMFLTRPAPLCVLDEVDAALDDSNVERFCALLTEIAKASNTRLLVVTHHPFTMTQMDRLYGVTMQEPGVSTMVSVDLAHAEGLREAS